MKTGRNDPCPCGSGKKYKKCCMDLDRAAAPDGPAPSGARSEIAATREWEVDVVPLQARIRDEPAVRPGVLLVLAGGFPLLNDVLERPSPEPEELAALLAGGVEKARERAGVAPGRVRVRHRELVEPLGRRLAEALPAGVKPPEVAAGPLPMLDAAAFALAESGSGHAHRSHLACPEAWAGWDLPPELVADLFRAAAELYRASPWIVLGNLDVLGATMPSGRRWTVNVLGQGGEVYGVNLYSEGSDFWRMVEEGEYSRAFDDLAGRVIALHFESGRDVGRAMIREVTAAGWELAGAQAYPRAFTINTPAGGLQRGDAEDLLALLGAVPRFLDDHARPVEGARPVESWTDEATGAELSYDPGRGRPRIVEPPTRLAPGDAQGPGAEPEAALTEAARVRQDPDAFRDGEQRFVEGFADHLSHEDGLSRDAADLHASNADLFVNFLCNYQGVPVRAVHEYDLRGFLFDWYPRKVIVPPEDSRALPGSLERFFAYLAAEEGIACPWAEGILAGEREAIEARQGSVPGHFFWENGVSDWRRNASEELTARLLLPDRYLGEDDVWGDTMGMTEADLWNELQRRWLLWRDERIRAGTDDPFELADALVERQEGWETAPHPDLGGKTPVEAIRAERRERDERLRRSAPKRGPKKAKKGKGKGRKR